MAKEVSMERKSSVRLQRHDIKKKLCLENEERFYALGQFGQFVDDSSFFTFTYSLTYVP